MIHSLKVENFYSINEQLELDFTTSKLYSDSYAVFGGSYVSRINCFVGANASGKTNVFRALAFLLWFAENSFYWAGRTNSILFPPHKLRETEETNFEVVFDCAEKLYRYKLVITPARLVSEILELQQERGFSYLYKLSNDNGKISIKYNRNKLLPPINKNDEERFKTRQNASFLSFLIGTGYLNALGLTGISQGGYSNVKGRGASGFDQAYEAVNLSKALSDSDAKSRVLPYLQNFDFGIEAFSKGKIVNVDADDVEILEFKHSGKDGSFDVSAFDESAGTIKGTYMLHKLLSVLDTGGIAIVDELDVRLHYDIARRLISLFANEDTNKNNAQLFFTTHQPLFLNDRDKSQIFLCYKEDYLNTEVYRLDEVSGVRNSENFFEKYLTGAYGATPRIGECR